jgi:hypothetical protein
VSEVREVDANLVRVLSRPSGEGVLERNPVRCMLNPVTGLGKEVGDQQRSSGGSHGRKLTRDVLSCLNRAELVSARL